MFFEQADGDFMIEMIENAGLDEIKNALERFEKNSERYFGMMRLIGRVKEKTAKAEYSEIIYDRIALGAHEH